MLEGARVGAWEARKTEGWRFDGLEGLRVGGVLLLRAMDQCSTMLLMFSSCRAASM